MRQQRASVDVDRVPAGRLDDRDAGLCDLVGEVLGRSDAVPQVRLLHHLLQAASDGLEVVPGQAAVRRKALGEDQQRAALLGPRVAAHREEAADVGEPVLLG